jgi:MFS family permease
MGFFYEKYEGILLWTGAIALSLGQLLTAIFSSEHRDYYFGLMMSGRVFEGIGAEILYMIQGNMASSWMGKYAGVVFILPEVGEIANVFITPLTFKHWGVRQSFLLGFFVCLVSTVACFFVYFGLKKRRSKNE